jgi:Protein of unknown function (DUF3237)
MWRMRLDECRDCLDDNELIFVSYNGVIQCSKEQMNRLNASEELKAGDCHFITAPTFETKSEKYGWLNAVFRRLNFIRLPAYVGDGPR